MSHHQITLASERVLCPASGCVATLGERADKLAQVGGIPEKLAAGDGGKDGVGNFESTQHFPELN